MELLKKLNKIQQELKAPKNQTNAFAKYKYRSCEDILEAVKPLLDGAVVILSDEVKCIGDRNYVEATATLREGNENLHATASARESIVKKGMDDGQITGSTSSYARKYALNGLFAIDDTKDADTMDNTPNQSTETTPNPKSQLLKRLESLAGKKLTASDKEWVIKTVEDKTGIRITSVGELDQHTAKNLIEVWNN